MMHHDTLRAFTEDRVFTEELVQRTSQQSSRACFYCGKVLSAARGFIETVSQPDGERRDFCSRECLHWQLHEDEKL